MQLGWQRACLVHRKPWIRSSVPWKLSVVVQTFDQRQEDEAYKVILGYIESWKPLWTDYPRLYLKKGDGEDEDLAQQVKALVAKPGDWSLISRTNITEGGPLTSTPALYYVHSNVSQQQEAVLERGPGPEWNAGSVI